MQITPGRHMNYENSKRIIVTAGITVHKFVGNTLNNHQIHRGVVVGGEGCVCVWGGGGGGGGEPEMYVYSLILTRQKPVNARGAEYNTTNLSGITK